MEYDFVNYTFCYENDYFSDMKNDYFSDMKNDYFSDMKMIIFLI